jgi:hypothetical protein
MSENQNQNVPLVYEAIAAVQADLSQEGISKDRKNQQQGYNFRGIDDIYNALAPILAKRRLCILPRVKSRELVERQTKNGGALFCTVLFVEFDFVSAVDGSMHTISTYGEAMDSADKSTNKAMSAAYKYATMMTFSIPTEGDNDADATTPNVAAKANGTHLPHPPAKPHAPPAKTGNDEPLHITDDQITIILSLLHSRGKEEAKAAAAVSGNRVSSIRAMTWDEAFRLIDRLEKMPAVNLA